MSCDVFTYGCRGYPKEVLPNVLYPEKFGQKSFWESFVFGCFFARSLDHQLNTFKTHITKTLTEELLTFMGSWDIAILKGSRLCPN